MVPRRGDLRPPGPVMVGVSKSAVAPSSGSVLPRHEVRFKAYRTPRARPPRGVRRMERLSFRQLPLVVRLAVGVAFLDAWVSFEEFVVDRHGLWRYMPLYRVGEFCVWDLAVV